MSGALEAGALEVVHASTVLLDLLASCQARVPQETFGLPHQ